MRILTDIDAFRRCTVVTACRATEPILRLTRFSAAVRLEIAIRTS
jgi:hypothetical protein